MKHIPFWVDDYPRPDNLTSDLPAECDVAIVGSGLTGISAAVRLAEGGRSVAVMDQGEIASGASSMNGGMVSPDVKAGIRTVYDKYGPDLAHEMWEATERSVDIVIDLTEKYGLDSRITRGGMVGLGMRADALEKLKQSNAWYRETFGVDWELLDRNRIHEVVGETDAFTCGYFEPEGIGIQPAGFVFGLARTAAERGASLVPNCAVESVRRIGAGFEVTTSRGNLIAGEVVVATNGYTTSRPLPELAKRIVSIGSYIIVTEPLPEPEAKAIFPTDAMTHTRKRLLNYMRRTHDNRILLGGRRNLHPDLDLEESAQDLHRRLLEFWPVLEGKEITHAWGGRLGVTFDLLPHMGQIDGVWYALGYGGHGVGLSTLMGHELAGMLLGEDRPSVFTKVPHPTRFYYQGSPWFLTPASVLYQTLDRVGR